MYRQKENQSVLFSTKIQGNLIRLKNGNLKYVKKWMIINLTLIRVNRGTMNLYDLKMSNPGEQTELEFWRKQAHLVCSVVEWWINLVVHVVLAKQEQDSGEEQWSTVIGKLRLHIIKVIIYSNSQYSNLSLKNSRAV